mgnify:CR=1 FL=1
MWSLVKKIAEQRGKSAINRRGVRSERKIDAILIWKMDKNLSNAMELPVFLWTATVEECEKNSCDNLELATMIFINF